MNKYILSDLYRYSGNTSVMSFLKAYVGNSTFRFQVALRLRQSGGVKRVLGKVLWWFSKARHSIKISPKTRIGYGLYIAHGGPIVVNPTTIIGDNVNLSQFTTIGANEGEGAIIGDNVYIGPGCCIVENVKIGDNTTIGAGSVVVKDIPDNATAVGNYARVINYNMPSRFIKNKWIRN